MPPNQTRIRNVKYELMKGRAASDAIQEFPVGYLPVGCLERHGDHLPMGLDAIKAHLVCIQVAQSAGGIVYPPHHYAGIHKFSANKTSKFTGEWGNIYTDTTAKNNLLEIINQIGITGIEVLVLYSGHYPLCQRQMIDDIAEEINFRLSVRVIPFYESMLFGGDHAGVSETSLMLYLDKNLVNMNQISQKNYDDHGWNKKNSPEEASPEKGAQYLHQIIEYLKRKIDTALKQR
jgi:creatinine amidohydrolase